MKTINHHTMNLIANYLELYDNSFRHYLDNLDIEPSEAEVIVDNLRAAFATNSEQPVIDRKFLINAINPTNGKLYDSHNAILLCAKDAAVPAALHAYQKECIRLGANPEHVESIGLLIDRVLIYQRMIESHVPDTLGAEIPRCLFGDGI